MKMKNNIKEILRRVVMVVVMIAGSVMNLNAQKLDLENDLIKIQNLGSQKAGDEKFKVNVDSLPAQIKISELAVNYEGKQPEVLTIKEINPRGQVKELYSRKVTGGITTTELKGGMNFIIVPENRYVFSHGSKEWILDFGIASESVPVASDDINIDSLARVAGIPEYRIKEGFKLDPSQDTKQQLEQIASNYTTQPSSVLPWWVYLIFGVLILCGAGAYFIGKRQGTIKEGQPASNDGSDSRDDQGALSLENIRLREALDELNSRNENLISLINSMDSNESLSPEDKLNKLRSMLTSNQEATECMAKLRRMLNRGEGVPGYLIISEIEKIYNTPPATPVAVKSDTQQKKQEFAKELVGKMVEKKKGNPMLSEIIEKGFKRGGADYAEVLKQIINIFPSHLQKNEPVVSNSGSIALTEPHQLDNQSNRDVAKRWVIDQIADYGYTDLNKNRPPREIFQKIADLMKKGSEVKELPSEEEIVTDVILGDRLLEDQKKVLLRRLVEKLNERLNSANKLDDKLSLEAFITEIAAALQQPSTHEEAQEQERQNNLRSVNEILDTDIDQFDQNSLRSAFQKATLKVLRKRFPDLKGENAEEILDQLQGLFKSDLEIQDLLKSFGVEKATQLPQAIREKQFEELTKSVAAKVETLLPERHFDSPQKLVNALIKVAEEEKENQELSADEIKKRIKEIGNGDVPSEDKTLPDLIDAYSKLVHDREKKLTDTLGGLTNDLAKEKDEVSKLQTVCENQRSEIANLTDEKNALLSESSSMVTTLHSDVEKILGSAKTILNPCSDNEENQCMDIEDRLYDALRNSMSVLRSYKAKSGVTPVETRKEIQQLLEKELTAENSPVNTICRYYAYSRLPFMTDTSREYGITFNRRNMTELFKAVQSLYVNFGIALDVPSLFVMGIEEGIFENVTGQFYGDLDNLCPSSRNHFDNIDSNSKPSNIIVDLVNVGYTVDGRQGRVTSVLTY